jgi:ADP-heptose:LPS heptosyltransferase
MQILNRLLDKYFIIYRTSNSIGDQFLMTAVLQKIYKKYNRPIIIFSFYKDLFLHHPYAFKVINYKNLSDDDSKFLFNKDNLNEDEKDSMMTLLMNAIKKNRKKLSYIHYFHFSWMNKENAHIKQSLVEFYSQGLDIDIKPYKPELYLQNEEIEKIKEKFNLQLPDKFYIIHSEGPMGIKNYGVERIQKIVDNTKEKINWIQVGIESDAVLNNIYLNLCGKISLRELCILVSLSKAVLSVHGLYTLIATAFNKKNYCIMNDYAFPEQTPYNNIIIIRRKKYHDKPCEICSCWYCDCRNSMKASWKNEINSNDISEMILDDLA